MKLAACLRAIAQKVQTLPEDQKFDLEFGTGLFEKCEFFRNREDVAPILMEIHLVRARLVMAEDRERRRRLPRLFVDRMLDAALLGQREWLPFLSEDEIENVVRHRELRDLVKKELRHMGFHVTNGLGPSLRVRW